MLGVQKKPRTTQRCVPLGIKAKLLLTRIYKLNQTINLYSTNQLTLEHIYVTFEGKAK